MMQVKSNFSFPWFSLTITMIVLGLFGSYAFLVHTGMRESDVYNYLGSPVALDIYDGQYWGVITNSLLHNRIEALALNLTGLWIFSAYIERRSGMLALFLLGLFASATTSIFQLTMTDNAGIGLSAVNYFFFSYILLKGMRNDAYKLPYRIVFLLLMLIILGLSWYVVKYLNWNLAVESMYAGIVLGSIFGLISTVPYRILRISVYVIVFIGSFSLILYAPWSSEWNLNKAVHLHNKGKLNSAKKFYRKALELNPDNINAGRNLYLIKLDDLSDKAYYWHAKGNYDKARFYYEEIINLDPDNKWALEQLEKLP